MRKEHNRSENHHRQRRAEECNKASAILTETVRGQPLEERSHAAGSVEGAWKAVMAWYQPQSNARRDQPDKELANIAMHGDEDPKIFLARAEGKVNVLSAMISHHEVFAYAPIIFCPSSTTWRSLLVFFAPVSRDEKWKMSFAPLMLTEKRKRLKIGS